MSPPVRRRKLAHDGRDRSETTTHEPSKAMNRAGWAGSGSGQSSPVEQTDQERAEWRTEG